MHVMKQHFFILSITLAVSMLMAGCNSGDSSQNNSVADTMPAFSPVFEERMAVVGDSVLFTYSSMEEADWKLANSVYGHFRVNDFNLALESVLRLSPESFDYDFSFVRKKCNIWIVNSDDCIIRCYDLEGDAAWQVPLMILQYRVGDKVKTADYGSAEDCYFCLDPIEVLRLVDGNTKLYIVAGYSGFSPEAYQFSLYAYMIDGEDLKPAMVFTSDGEDSHCVNVDFCPADEIFRFSKDFPDIDSYFYYSEDEKVFYVREVVNQEKDESGCSTKMTDQYIKYSWNGKRFVTSK